MIKKIILIFYILFSTAVFAQNKLSEEWYLYYQSKKRGGIVGGILNSKGGTVGESLGPYSSKNKCESDVLNLPKDYEFIGCFKNK